jgi:hypothetical protein
MNRHVLPKRRLLLPTTHYTQLYPGKEKPYVPLFLNLYVLFKDMLNRLFEQMGTLLNLLTTVITKLQ